MCFVCFVVRHILETAVTEREFLEQLHELNHKINFVKEQSFKDARSCLDVRDILEKLKIKVSISHFITVVKPATYLLVFFYDSFTLVSKNMLVWKEFGTSF